MIDDNKNNPNYLHPKAGALRNISEYEKAITVYDKILAIDPDNTIALNDKGLCLMNLKKHQLAIDECFDETLAIDPKNVYALQNKGAALYDLGRYEESITQGFELVLKIESRNVKAWDGKGWALQSLGRYADAWYSYDKSVKYKNIEERKKKNKS